MHYDKDLNTLQGEYAAAAGNRAEMERLFWEMYPQADRLAGKIWGHPHLEYFEDDDVRERDAVKRRLIHEYFWKRETDSVHHVLTLSLKDFNPKRHIKFSGYLADAMKSEYTHAEAYINRDKRAGRQREYHLPEIREITKNAAEFTVEDSDLIEQIHTELKKVDAKDMKFYLARHIEKKKREQIGLENGGITKQAVWLHIKRTNDQLNKSLEPLKNDGAYRRCFWAALQQLYDEYQKQQPDDVLPAMKADERKDYFSPTELAKTLHYSFSSRVSGTSNIRILESFLTNLYNHPPVKPVCKDSNTGKDLTAKQAIKICLSSSHSRQSIFIRKEMAPYVEYNYLATFPKEERAHWITGKSICVKLGIVSSLESRRAIQTLLEETRIHNRDTPILSGLLKEIKSGQHDKATPPEKMGDIIRRFSSGGGAPPMYYIRKEAIIRKEKEEELGYKSLITQEDIDKELSKLSAKKPASSRAVA